MNTRHTRAEVAYYDAEERVLASVDVFQDWFSAQVADASAELELPAQIREEVTEQDFATAPVKLLYMLMIDAGQKPQTRVAAMDAMASRYLAAKADYVELLASERRAA